MYLTSLPLCRQQLADFKLLTRASFSCPKDDKQSRKCAPLSSIPTLTRALDGDLQVGEVLLIGKDLDAIRRVCGQRCHFLVYQADNVRGQVLHVGVLGTRKKGVNGLQNRDALQVLGCCYHPSLDPAFPDSITPELADSYLGCFRRRYQADCSLEMGQGLPGSLRMTLLSPEAPKVCW